jgi:type II secretory pathway component GspD/PulD (secretin)
MGTILRPRSSATFLLVMLLISPAMADENTGAVGFDPFAFDTNAPERSTEDSLDQSPLIQDIRFQNNDISDVFQIISDLTGWSIFPTTQVTSAKVSLWARGITAKEVLERAVEMAGFIHHQEGNVVTVMTYDEYMQFYGLAKKVFGLKYASADSISTVITKFLSKLGKSVVHQQTNTLVLFDSEANLETITDIIAELDTPFEAEMVLDVIDLRYMDSEILAETLRGVFSDAQLTGSSKKQQVPAPTDRSKERITDSNTPTRALLSTPKSAVGVYSIGRTNQLIVKAVRSDIEQLKKLVEKLDTYVEPTTKSYHFVYVDAAEIYRGLERILDIPVRSGAYGRGEGRGTREGGRPGGITLVEKTNSILLTAPPSVHRVMTSIVDTVDVAATYEAGVIRIYKLDNADIDEVATAIRELLQSREEQAKKTTGEPKFTKQPAETAPQPQTQVEVSETEDFIPQIEARVAVSKATNSVIVQATARQHRELEKLIAELDKRRKQVLIEAMIIEVTTSDDMDLGVELNHAGNSALAFTSFGLSSIDLSTGERDILVGPGGTAAVIEPDDVQAILQALQSTGNIRITSAPRILVNDNASGNIVSIAEEPTTQTNQGETTTTTSFAGFVEAGTQFQITPHISETDYLRVEYSITLNAFGEKADPVIPPARSTSQIQSEATVPDGHTIIVGGLQSSHESENVDKVPVLGDIPLLGLAFRSTIVRQQYITTYLFIKTSIMRSDDFADLKEVSEKALDETKEHGINLQKEDEGRQLKPPSHDGKDPGGAAGL